jgi:hypothetical protein
MKSLIILMALLLCHSSFANSVDDFLLMGITESEVLEDFWTGDDGEECGEPQVLILKRLDKSLTIKVIPTGYVIGCYEVEFVCSLTYRFVGNDLVFSTLDSTRDCQQR